MNTDDPNSQQQDIGNVGTTDNIPVTTDEAPAIADGAHSLAGSKIWLAKHIRTVWAVVLIPFFSFPVIYLIFNNSLLPASDPASQAAPVFQSPDIPSMENMASQNPTTENLLNLSVAFYRARRFSECIAAARNAIELKPDYAEAYNNMSAAFNGILLYDSAIANANEAIRLKPDFQLAKNNLAFAIGRKEMSKNAVDSLEKFTAQKPTPENLLDLSIAYFRSGQFDDCIKAAKKALKLKPDYPEAWNNICCADNRLGHFEDGKAAAEEALRIKPGFTSAQKNLDVSLNGLEELKKKK